MTHHAPLADPHHGRFARLLPPMAGRAPLFSVLCMALLVGACAPMQAPAGPAPQRSPVAQGGADPAAAPLRSAVIEEAALLFGDADAAGVDDETGAVTWDIDVHSYETHERVAYYMDRFSRGMSERFTMWLERGSSYEPMIRAKLRAKGLPEDLTYIALIESGYDNHAYSRAAAVGMWQFMTATAKGTGLRVDWWVDERRDPIMSTDAGIKYLGWLNQQFGSLYLAAAAYNGGPGRVSRGLVRFADEMADSEGEDRFFALAEQDYLHSETKDYVPKLIAAALVAKEPQRYGLRVRTLEPFAYDSVRVGAGVPLSAVATAARTTVAEIRELNGAILRGMTPPDAAYWIKLPIGASDGFAERMDSLPAADRTGYTRVRSRSGETVAAFADRRGVSVAQLNAFNPGLSSVRGRMNTARDLLVPSSGTLSGMRNVPDPAIERYGTSANARVTTHVVRRGETLSQIARQYGTNTVDLQRLNSMKKTVIIPGQVIIVRRAAGTAATAARPAARAPAAAPARPAVRTAAPVAARARSGSAASTKVHVVKQGESLSVIAQRYGTTTRRLQELNKLSGTRINVGQKLVVPA